MDSGLAGFYFLRVDSAQDMMCALGRIHNGRKVVFYVMHASPSHQADLLICIEHIWRKIPSFLRDFSGVKRTCWTTGSWRSCLSLEVVSSIPAWSTIIYRFLCGFICVSLCQSIKIKPTNMYVCMYVCFKFLAWSSIAQSVCEWACSLLAIRCLETSRFESCSQQRKTTCLL